MFSKFLNVGFVIPAKLLLSTSEVDKCHHGSYPGTLDFCVSKPAGAAAVGVVFLAEVAAQAALLADHLHQHYCKE